MVLFVLEEENQWSVCDISNHVDLYSNQYLQKCHDVFCNSPVYTITSADHSILYVHQSEVAQNIPENQFNIIGSDDATTCHIIFASYVVSHDDIHERRWVVSHIDAIEKIHELVDYLNQIPDNPIDIYIMGGLGDDNLSNDLSQTFLTLFQSSPKNYHLQLFFTCQLNTIIKEDNINYPKFYGCGYHKLSNSIIPMSIPIQYRGPQYLLRSSSFWIQDSTDRKQLTPIYISNSLHINLTNFSHDITPEFRQFFHTITQLPRTPQVDQFLLEHTSTSPQCEPNHFISSLRDVANVIVQNYAVNGQSQYEGPDVMIFILQMRDEGRGEWIRVEN